MENQEQKVPTREEVREFLKEQIEMKTLQLELQELDTKIAVQKMEYMKAIYTMAQINQATSAPKEMEHVLTEEDLAHNPDLKEQGLKVGDVVTIPMEEEETPAPQEKPAGLKATPGNRNLKK